MSEDDADLFDVAGRERTQIIRTRSFVTPEDAENLYQSASKKYLEGIKTDLDIYRAAQRKQHSPEGEELIDDALKKLKWATDYLNETKEKALNGEEIELEENMETKDKYFYIPEEPPPPKEEE